MPLVRVGPASHPQPGAVAQVEVEGRTLAVCNSGGTLYALDGTCPHAGGPLAHGALHGVMLVCPWHAWEFDCRTGENDFDPGVRVETYPVATSDGGILIDVP